VISTVEPRGADILKKLEEFNAEDRIGLRLLENNVHFLTGDIEAENVNQTIQWIVYENLNPGLNKKLTLYISSMGGDLYSAFGLIDIIKNSQLPVRTIGIGPVMSAAFMIFVAGTKGERYVARNTALMCHQYSDSPEGKHQDLKATMKEGENCNNKMVEILVEATGLTAAKVRQKLLPATDVYLTAQEALELSVADNIL
jgi:ATP-dependent Clp endopeptidase proteolytic subunit ClpP